MNPASQWFVSCFLAGAAAIAAATGCNIFSGKWVKDMSSYSVYDNNTCPFINREFNCLQNGRPDLDYLFYRWQPTGCTLLRFDGRDFLRRYRGRSIMFVGDSLSRNQWSSMTCLLHTSLPGVSYTFTYKKDLAIFLIPEYDIRVMVHHTEYLMEITIKEVGRVLRLGTVVGGGAVWRDVDILIFNTWHWWLRRGPTQPWDYMEYDGVLVKDMDRVEAFRKALTTWGHWVDMNLDPTLTPVFFQGISPSHYNANEWNGTGTRGCLREKEPIEGGEYPGGMPRAAEVVKEVIQGMRKKVQLLDVTLLSQLRKDGHPSEYGVQGIIDCSHWCVAGVTDTWNQLLYNLLLHTSL